MKDSCGNGISSRTITIVTLLFLLTFVASTHADYSITVSGNGSHVSIVGDLLQAVPSSAANNTAEPFDRLPVFTYHFSGDNASLFSNNLTSALRQRSTGALAEKVTLDTTSNGTNYHYGLSYDVSGISASQNDLDKIDLSWRSFALGGDFKQNGTSLNALVPAYLLSSLSLYSQLPASSPPPNIITRQWYFNRFILQRGN